MSWAFKFNGSDVQVRLDSLPWRELQRLAKAHASAAPMWVTWKDYPLAIAATDLDAFQALREVAAAAAGATIEPFGDTAHDAEQAMLELVEVEDDIPNEWTDGIPPTGSPATT